MFYTVSKEYLDVVLQEELYRKLFYHHTWWDMVKEGGFTVDTRLKVERAGVYSAFMFI